MASQAEEYSQLNISEEEKDKLVGEVVRYVLFKTHQSSGCPIKREDLTQIVTRNYHQRSLPALVINDARHKLSSVFGFEMRELLRARPSSGASSSRSSQSVAGDAKSYVLVSKLPHNVYQKYVEDEGLAHLNGFTFVVVGIVHLSGGSIPEENLWHHLRRMGVSEKDEHHPVFGSTKQALEMVVQQRYLLKEKVNGPEGSSFVYLLAERALDGEVSERIKEYILKIVRNDVSPVEN